MTRPQRKPPVTLREKIERGGLYTLDGEGVNLNDLPELVNDILAVMEAEAADGEES